MSDGFKNTLAILGSFIFVLFVIFCIGMCSSAFRGKVYDIMDVVPESEYLTLGECNELISNELAEKESKLVKMTHDKATLETTIQQLQNTHSADEMTIANYQTQVDILNIQIDEANTQIAKLRADMVKISNSVNNATVTYKSDTVNVEYPVFDDNNNLMHYTGFSDSQGTYWGFYGQDLINEWNNHYGKINDNIQKALDDGRYSLRLNVGKIYAVTIDGCMYNIHCGNTGYSFTRNATFDTIITFDGNTIASDDLVSEINANADYKVVLNLNYLTNADNLITGCVMEFNITTLE